MSSPVLWCVNEIFSQQGFIFPIHQVFNASKWKYKTRKRKEPLGASPAFPIIFLMHLEDVWVGAVESWGCVSRCSCWCLSRCSCRAVTTGGGLPVPLTPQRINTYLAGRSLHFSLFKNPECQTSHRFVWNSPWEAKTDDQCKRWTHRHCLTIGKSMLIHSRHTFFEMGSSMQVAECEVQTT